jgi:hypothetical protein
MSRLTPRRRTSPEDELGDAVVGEACEPRAQLIGGPAHRRLLEHRVAARVPGGVVGLVEADAVLLVHREVALLERRAIDDRLPLRAARHLLQRAAELVGTVVGEREARPSRRPHALGGGVLAVLQDGSPEQERDP